MNAKSQRDIFASNLRRLVHERGIDQRTIAVKLGVSDMTVSNWINGTKYPRINRIQALAELFNVKMSELMEEHRPANIIPTSRRTVRIPVLGEIACGEPLYVEENFSGYKEEIADFVPNGNVFYLVAKGDSMEPTIPNGAYVLVREQPTVETGEIAAVLVNGNTEATLKRVKRQGEIVILDPDNPAYNPIIITESNPAKIIGKALKYTRDL